MQGDNSSWYYIKYLLDEWKSEHWMIITDLGAASSG